MFMSGRGEITARSDSGKWKTDVSVNVMYF